MSSSVTLAKNLTSVSLNISCGNCGKTDQKLMRCSSCQLQYYCDQSCQNKHWPEHKKVCPLKKSEGQTDSNIPKQDQLWSSIQQKSREWLKVNQNVIPSEQSAMKSGNVAPLIEEFFSTQVQEGKIALDMGCGMGKTTFYLLKRGWRVISLDVIKWSIENLENNAKKHCSAIEKSKLVPLQASIEDYNFPEKVHLIIVNDVFPYCNPAKFRGVWDKIYNSLEKDGHLIGSLFDRNGASNQTWRTCWFVDNKKFVEDLLDNSLYQRQVCRYRPKPSIRSDIIEFSAKKIAQ